MERVAMPFSRNQYSRYASPDSGPAYRPSYGYLSPPYSCTRSPTTEAIFPSSSAGLGISQYRFEPQYEQQSLYASHSEQFNPTFKSEHDLSIIQGAIMPARYVPQSPYPASTRCPSYYSTPQHHYPPVHHDSSMLARLAEGDIHEQVNYHDNAVPSAESISDRIHYGFQPDPMHHDRWTTAPHEVVHTVPDTQSDTLAWGQSGLQEYQYRDHYVDRHYVSDDSAASTEPCSSNLSTPPASQDGKQLQYPDVHQATPDTQLKGHQFETIKPESRSPSTTTTTTPVQRKSKDTVKNRKSTKRIEKADLQCRHCPKTFSRQSKLREHEKIHVPTPAACPEKGCDLVYGRQADLARHQRSKHKLISFPCRFCLKGFNRSDITRRHEEQSCRVRKAEEASQGMILHNNQPRR